MPDQHYEQLYQALRDAGQPVEEGVPLDGSIHRYGPRSSGQPEWVIAFELPSGHIAAEYGDWRRPEFRGHFKSWELNGSSGQLSNDEHKKLLAHQRRQEKRRKQKSAEAAVEAKRRWDEAQIPDSDDIHVHPYTSAKGIPPIGCRVEGDNLLIPVFDTSGDGMVSLQIIGPNGAGKLFLPGGKTGNGSCVIGDNPVAKEVFITEGWATGVSVHIATGSPVVIGFNSTNLPKVAESLKKRSPAGSFIVAADDDHWHADEPTKANFPDGTRKGNAGRKAAAIIEKTCGYPAVFPDFSAFQLPEDVEPTDFNDLHQVAGLDTVKKQLRRIALPDIEVLWEPALDEWEMPPVEFVVDRLIPPGFYFLTGASKVGKTFLSMSIARGVACGGRFAGEYQCRPGQVIYALLEGKQRRAKIRLIHAKSNGYIPHPDMGFVFDWPRLPTALDAIRQTAETIPDLRLVVFDLWAHVVPADLQDKIARSSDGGYMHMTEVIAPIRDFLADQHIAVLAVHHKGKGGRDDHTLEYIGSTGLAAACDGIISISRPERTEPVYRLQASGNDLEEIDIKLHSEAVGLFEHVGPWLDPDREKKAKPGPASSVSPDQILGIVADPNHYPSIHKDALRKIIESQFNISPRTARRGIQNAASKGAISIDEKGFAWVAERTS